MAPVTYPRRLHDLALEEPDAPAITVVEPGGASMSFTRAELDHRSAALARALADAGVTAYSLVLLAIPNSVEFVECAYASWWLGACVLPLSTKLVAAEQAAILAAASDSGRPIVTVVADGVHVGPADIGVSELLDKARALPADPPTDREHDVVSFPGRALPSGGSTGRPKIIVDTRPLAAEPDAPNPLGDLLGRHPGQTALVVGPAYHALPFGTVFGTLFERGHLVLMTRFDAATALDAIERYRVEVMSTVPIQLQRMARVPGAESRDLSSLVSLYHSGAACPEWLKRRWMDLLGPVHVYEGFGSTEAVGMLVIRGDEWLEHPGSVGRGVTTDVVVRGPDGANLPAGEVGEIFMRWRSASGSVGSSLQGATYRYWGSEVPPAPDRFVSVGDLGWLDDDGYLFVADRRVDMIITGGVNVYPAEVEAAITEHPEVDDVVVVGVPDPEWGRRVHAIIATRRPPPHPQELVTELDRRCRERLSSVKVPKTYELVTALSRNEAGKVRRAELAAERASAPAAPIYVPAPERRTHVD
jgi:bile acid-coenzyme A ligase